MFVGLTFSCLLLIAGVIVMNNYQCVVRLNKPSLISSTPVHVKTYSGKDCDQRRNIE